MNSKLTGEGDDGAEVQKKALQFSPIYRPLKTRDRRDRRSCQEGWCLCQIVASWDLFFGACHFCSMKTVDLATI